MKSDVVVFIADGKLRGETKKDADGNLFYSFEGIPYGKPPVGELRFKAPQPVEPWTGIKDVVKKGPFCYSNRLEKLLSKDFTPDKTDPLSFADGSEDCLNLNIYTRQLPENGVLNLRPVMFYVHGGAFSVGDTRMYGPNFLITEDVLIVTIHYRLGALGFLVLESEEADVPGNAALKDMLLALKWVQKNIKNFNGDPDNVTMFGQSAGGVATHLSVLSPLCKGMFHKAIIQSGSAFCSWATGDAQNGKKLAEVLGCKSKDDTEILKFLQSLSVKQIYLGQLQVPEIFKPSQIRPFTPIVEVNSKLPFISNQILDSIKSGDYNHVPIMTGYTDREGLFLPILEQIGMKVEFCDDSSLIPYSFGVEPGTEQGTKLIGQIKNMYYKDETPSATSKAAMLFASDIFFIREIYLHTKLHSATSKRPVYLYRLTTKVEFPSIFAYPLDRDGVCHCEDISYIFKENEMSKVEPGSDQDKTRKRLVRIWTNFAKTGNPNTPIKPDGLIPVTWKPVTKDEINYLNIGTNLVTGKNPDDDRMKFWEDIYHQVVGNMFDA